MGDIKLVLTEYEAEALKSALSKYREILEDQIKAVNKIKHSTNKKEIKRNLTKKVNLLQDILNKLR